MKCPFCKSEDNRVVNVRRFDTCNIRLRLCMECQMGWHTEELIQVTEIEKLAERHSKIKLYITHS